MTTPLAMLTGDPHVAEGRRSRKELVSYKAEIGDRNVYDINMLIGIACIDMLVQ